MKDRIIARLIESEKESKWYFEHLNRQDRYDKKRNDFLETRRRIANIKSQVLEDILIDEFGMTRNEVYAIEDDVWQDS